MNQHLANKQDTGKNSMTFLYVLSPKTMLQNGLLLFFNLVNDDFASHDVLWKGHLGFH